MSDEVGVKVYKENETFMKIESEKHVLYEIWEYFTIDVPGAKFMPAYKKGWDGKLRLFNLRSRRLYIGLLYDLIELLKQYNYEFLIDKSLKVGEGLSDTELDEYIESLNLPYEIRDYQREALKIGLNNYRAVLLSPTGSGKSLVIYSLIRYFKDHKILLIVPTLSLTTQMYTDFQDYAKRVKWDPSKYVHVITGGVEKQSQQSIYISTWQSLYSLDKEYFEQFDVVIVDETHLAQANSIKKILESSTNAQVKIGLTGTLQETKTHLLTIKGLLGPIHKVSQTHELQKQNVLANMQVKMVVLEYSESERKQVKSLNYQDEVDFLLEHENRNKFIDQLTLKQKGNTLLLASYVDKQGKLIYDRLRQKSPWRPIFFVSGEMPKDEREKIRQYTEEHDDVIIVATYGVFSTGINIRKLHNIIFALAGKSRIRNLQSIGRGLRVHDSKEQLTLYDIGDDLRMGSQHNYSLSHFEKRYKQYIQENFKVSFSKVPLYQQLL